MRPKIRCDGESWKFLGSKQGLTKTYENVTVSHVIYKPHDWEGLMESVYGPGDSSR